MNSSRKRNKPRSTVATTVAATAAVAYGSYRLAQWYWDEDEETSRSSDKPSLVTTTLTEAAKWWFAPEERPSRRKKLSKCRYQTRIAFRTCFSTLRPSLETLTDTARLTKDLKALRRETGDKEREISLWREMLLETTTRMLATSYAYTLLFLSLTVQFHASSNERSEKERETMLVQSHQYFLHQGLPLLVSTIRKALKTVLFESDDRLEETTSSSTSWGDPSTCFVTQNEVEERLYKRVPCVLDTIGIGNRRRNWIRFVWPDDERFDSMWDIGRSPIWEDAQEQVLGYLWHSVLRDGGDSEDCYGWGMLFVNDADDQPRLPLAKVLARFKKASSGLFDQNTIDEESLPARDSTILPQKLQSLPTVLELGEVSLP